MRSRVPSFFFGGGVRRGSGFVPTRRESASAGPSAGSPALPSRSRTTRRTAMLSSESEDVPTESSYAVSDDRAAAAAAAAATLFPSAASRALDFKSSGGRMSKRDEGSSRAVDALRGGSEGESRGAPRRESTPPCAGTNARGRVGGRGQRRRVRGARGVRRPRRLRERALLRKTRHATKPTTAGVVRASRARAGSGPERGSSDGTR